MLFTLYIKSYHKNYYSKKRDGEKCEIREIEKV